MKNLRFSHFIFVAIAVLSWQVACQPAHQESSLPAKEAATFFKNGDLIFHASTSNQSRAIQLATGSKYSHCGILYEQDGEWMVLEAVQPVKFTPLDSWIKRGKNGQYAVKRLLDEKTLTPAKMERMKAVGQEFLGKSYDLAFEWSDDRIYCSELIYKIYDEGAGIQLCPLKKLKDYNLSNPVVQKIVEERYGKNIPFEEWVVPPSALFESDLLVAVPVK